MIFPRNFSCMSHNSSAVFFNETLPNRLAAIFPYSSVQLTWIYFHFVLSMEVSERWGHPMCTEFDEHWRQTVVTGNKVRWVLSHIASLFDSQVPCVLYQFTHDSALKSTCNVIKNSLRYIVISAGIRYRVTMIDIPSGTMMYSTENQF